MFHARNTTHDVSANASPCSSTLSRTTDVSFDWPDSRPHSIPIPSPPLTDSPAPEIDEHGIRLLRDMFFRDFSTGVHSSVFSDNLTAVRGSLLMHGFLITDIASSSLADCRRSLIFHLLVRLSFLVLHAKSNVLPGDDIKLGALYDPNLLPDYKGPYFEHVNTKLIQHDIRDIEENLIAPWDAYEALCPGTVVLIEATLKCWIFAEEKGDETRQKKVRIFLDSLLDILLTMVR